MARPREFVAVAQRLRAIIGPLRDGWTIPSCRQLARQLMVSPGTVRKALGLLLAEGLIERAAGAQSYVRTTSQPQGRFYRPYPRVAVLASPHWLLGLGYLTHLIGGFLGRMASLGVPSLVCHPETSCRGVPGGLELATPPIRCSAIVLPGGAGDSLLRVLASGDAAVMTLDYLAHLPGVDSVAIDCEGEVRMILDYLLQRGHRNIGFVCAQVGTAREHWSDGLDPDARRFEASLVTAKNERGLPFSAAQHVVANSTRSNLTAGLGRMMRLIPPPTAVICFDVPLAQEVEQILRERYGLDCPRDVSIVARGFRPARGRYTMTESDPGHMGEVAAHHLFRRMTDVGTGACCLTFPSVLVEGSSVATVPQK